MERLDARLVSNGTVSGRSKAKELIENGFVTVNGRVITKASFSVTDADEITCDTSSIRYVGRGGYKLEKALTMAEIPIAGMVAMDVGASTGGFTDCMLQNGAARVYAVDVGHGQLHPTLCADPRVVNLEGTDIRHTEQISQTVEQGSIHLCSVDVSFISLTSVMPYIVPFLADHARVIVLIKPQFEAGRSDIGKGGIVKNPAVHKRVLKEITAFLESLPFRVLAVEPSPITGGDGNVEFLAVLCYTTDKRRGVECK